MKGSFKKRNYADIKTGAKRSVTTWTVTYDEPTSPGEPRKQRRKAGFATRKAAEKWFDRKREQLERGFTGIDDKTTVADYLKHWLAGISVGAGTRRMYESYARRFVVPALGRVRLCDLKPSHLEGAKHAWARKRRDTKDKRLVSGRAVRHAWTVLATALNRAKKQRIISFNPCEYVDAPRFERHEMKSLDVAGAESYLRAFSADLDIGAAVTVAIGSGLRRGELLALRWCDVDLEAGTVRVARSLESVAVHDPDDEEKRKPELRFKDPKTAGSRRLIPLPAFAIDRLKRHRREQKDRFDALGIWRTNDSLVFEHAGEPWNPNTFGTEFAKRAQRLKLPRVRLHDLRHSYATLMLESGVDLKTVSQALGHSTIRITADTYAHVTPAMQQSAAERLDRAIGGSRESS
jgi:integrase